MIEIFGNKFEKPGMFCVANLTISHLTVVLFLQQAGGLLLKSDPKKVETALPRELKLESAATPGNNNNRSILDNIGRRVAMIKSRYAALHRMSKELQCYSQRCSEQV